MGTQVWAHRGANIHAPENTLAAFRMAAAQGADGITLNVQMSRDGTVVVAHDESLERVSDSNGFLKDYTLKELKQMNFNCGKERYGFVSIPTLEEVLEVVKKNGLIVNVEFKTNIIPYDGIETEVLQLVKKHEMEEKVIYSSFHYETIHKLRDLKHDAKLGMLFSHIWDDAAAYADYMGVDAIHPPYRAIEEPAFVESCRNRNLDIHVWTVNRELDCIAMAEKGVEAIITDYPDKGVTAISRQSISA